MKKNNVFWLMFMCLVLLGSGCSSDDTPKGEDDKKNVITDEAMDAMIATYVDRVVIPTYKEMEEKVKTLRDAVNTFYDSDAAVDLSAAQAALNMACDAWRAARNPWEESEAFLYGPADYENLDPSLDSWPLDKDGLDQLLALGEFGSIGNEDPDDETLAEEAQSLRGFHTLEYLLFEKGLPKKVEDVTTNEKKYAKAVAARLFVDTEQLHKAWAEGLGTEEVPEAFGEELKKHTSGRTGSAENIIGDFIIDGGIVNILDEVGGQKIGNPYDLWKKNDREMAVLQVESWYSWNSLKDYTDNVVSVENAYLGGRSGNRDDAKSLSALVRLVDTALDTKVKNQIEATKRAINDIPAPFRDNLGATTEIEVAMDACAELVDLFKEVKTALALNE